jgi:protein TonB
MAWPKVAEAVRRQVVYPMLARRRGLQGRVVVRFMLDASGKAADLSTVESSGHEILDAAALEAVRRAVPMPAPAVPTQIVLPIVFALH